MLKRLRESKQRIILFEVMVLAVTRLLRHSAGVIASSVVFTGLTFFRKTVVLRQRVDPDWEPAASHFVEARGWPLAFVADDPQALNVGRIGLEDKIFWTSLVLDWVTILLLVSLLWIVISFVRAQAVHSSR